VVFALTKNVKSGQTSGQGSLLEFWDPLHTSGTVEARNFKFGTHIDREGQ